MAKHDSAYDAHSNRSKQADDEKDQLGIYKPGFQFQDEALSFLRLCVSRETYERVMNSEAGKRHHYVAARALLSQVDWEKFVWIEKYGSLTGFPKY